MANNITLRGLCPTPFLDLSKFPEKGGHITGRLCSTVDPSMDLQCCLPCPATDWIYPESFEMWYRISEYLGAVSICVCVFLLISWSILPVDKTRRHYLSICLVITIIMEAVAFVIPLGARPQQCFNEITPHDMYSDLSCAFSGAFVIAGGLGITIWILIRSLSMHLQICWDIIPGNKFFYFSQIVGWGLTGLFFTLTMTFTGVSYRFGDMCHVNSEHSIAVFWGPLLGMAGATTIIQVLTFLYCIKVYLSNMWSDEPTGTNASAGMTSGYSASLGAHSAKAVYQRVKKVLWLQWRSIMIVVFLVVDVIFFSIVWIGLDTTVKQLQKGDTTKVRPFLVCLVANSDPSVCHKLGQEALTDEDVSIAILILLSIAGIQTGFSLSRTSLYKAWGTFLKKKFRRDREFVSLDAKRFSNSDSQAMDRFKVTSPNRAPTADTLVSGTETYLSSKEHAGSPTFHYGQTMEREYRRPTMSFSGPGVPPGSPPPSGHTGFRPHQPYAHTPVWDDPEALHSHGGPGDRFDDHQPWPGHDPYMNRV